MRANHHRRGRERRRTTTEGGGGGEGGNHHQRERRGERSEPPSYGEVEGIKCHCRLISILQRDNGPRHPAPPTGKSSTTTRRRGSQRWEKGRTTQKRWRKKQHHPKLVVVRSPLLPFRWCCFPQPPLGGAAVPFQENEKMKVHVSNIYFHKTSRNIRKF